MLRLLRLFWLTVAGSLGSALWAHPTLDSQLFLDVREDSVGVSLRMPLPDLLIAQPSLGDLAAVVGARATLSDQALRQYVLTHLRLGTASGPSWPAEVLAWRIQPPSQPDEPSVVEVEARFQSLGLVPERLLLHAEPITHEVRNQSTVVLLRSDWRTGVAASAPKVLGHLNHERKRLVIQRGSAKPWAAGLGFVNLGMDHILEGYDHLLFLALVLLATCLQRGQARWVGTKMTAKIWPSALWVISAFTVGHSLTLVLSGLGWVGVSTRWVESLVALSVVVSAIHVWRPLFEQQELWVAAGFGLVHGLAFAQALQLMHLQVGERVTALLAFNVGVELAQVALALIFIPLLVWALRRLGHRVVRVPAAGVALIVGLFWFVQRAAAAGF